MLKPNLTQPFYLGVIYIIQLGCNNTLHNDIFLNDIYQSQTMMTLKGILYLLLPDAVT
jgi:hypothetical protein